MSTPSNVPQTALEVFKGITFETGFLLELLDAAGVPTGAFYDFTDKDPTVVFSDIFAEDLVLAVVAGTNANGSYLQLVGLPTAGSLALKLSATDLALVTKLRGYWRMEVRDPPDDAILLTHGVVKVVPFTADQYE